MSTKGSQDEQKLAPGNEDRIDGLQNQSFDKTANPESGPENGVEGNGCAGSGAERRAYHSPGSVALPEVKPWPEPVDGAELLDGLMSELHRFVVFPKWATETFALWILHT